MFNSRKFKKSIFATLIVSFFTIFLQSCADKVYEENGWKVTENTLMVTNDVGEQLFMRVDWQSESPLLEEDLEITIKLPSGEVLSKELKNTSYCKFSGTLVGLGDAKGERSVEAECTFVDLGYYVFQIKNPTNAEAKVDLFFEYSRDDGTSTFTKKATKSLTAYAKQSYDEEYDFD